MKKVFFAMLMVGLLSAVAFAQDGPYSMSIGSGAGSFSITESGITGIYSFGNIRGDCGDFYANATDHGTTIWNLCLFIQDKTNSQYYFMDKNFTGAAHVNNKPVDGTINTTTLPTSFTNTGMTFPNSAGLTADLTVALSQPTAGDTVRLTNTYAFANSGGSPIDLKMIYFLDADSYIDGGSGYNTDLKSACDSDFITGNDRVTMAIGENDGTGKVDLNKGIKIDCDTAINDYMALNNNTGPSYWWSNSAPYNPNGMDTVLGIHADYSKKMELDVDANLLSDEGRDSAIAIQTEFTVPAGGSKTVNFYATWGLDQILNGWAPPTSIRDWELF